MPRAMAADEISSTGTKRNRRLSAENAGAGRSNSKERPWTLPSTPPAPVARPAKGADIASCLSAMEAALEQDGPGFIAFTIMWRRLLALADDAEIARHQAEVVHRYRRVLARRGYSNVLVVSVLERTERHGLHGHLLAQAPRVADHANILDAVERGLARRYGRVPPRTFNRDGWHDGSIRTAAAARGALAYRLKSLPREAEEHGVRRGVGLRPVGCVSVRLSRGRRHVG